MNTTLTIKLPKELRDDAKETAAALGLPLTTVVQRQLRDFVEKKEMTFTAPVQIHRVSARTLSREAKQKLARAKKLPRDEFVNL